MGKGKGNVPHAFALQSMATAVGQRAPFFDMELNASTTYYCGEMCGWGEEWKTAASLGGNFLGGFSIVKILIQHLENLWAKPVTLH